MARGTGDENYRLQRQYGNASEADLMIAFGPRFDDCVTANS